MDAFKQLYTFMEVPPLFCFYDFACGLSEYALNREPLFFKSTGWYHDIFHGLVSPCCTQSVQVCVCVCKIPRLRPLSHRAGEKVRTLPVCRYLPLVCCVEDADLLLWSMSYIHYVWPSYL